MEQTQPSVKDRILQQAEQHPYILLAAVCILIVVVIVQYLYSCGYIGSESRRAKKKKGKANIGEELDDLIESINEKQRGHVGDDS